MNFFCIWVWLHLRIKSSCEWWRIFLFLIAWFNETNSLRAKYLDDDRLGKLKMKEQFLKIFRRGLKAMEKNCGIVISDWR